MRQQGMYRSVARFGVLVALLFDAMLAAAATPLVDVDWLKANVGKPGVAIIDFQSAGDFLRGHIPGAANSNYGKDGWRENRADKVPAMLPTNLDKLTALIGKLGVDDKTHVVLVSPGNSAHDMGISTRVYWTFKVLGHDEVSILDGGMAAWTSDKKNPLEMGAAKVKPKSFKVSLRKDMIVTMDDVRKAKAAGVVLVDNRPPDFYLGITRHPMATVAGTIEGARNVPENWLTVDDGGKFRSRAQLEQLYKYAGVPTSGEQVNFCNTGHWASIGWFASSELLGNKKAKLYDGSMTEWTMLKGPVEQKVKVQ